MSACIKFAGYIDKNGYGRIYCRGKWGTAHRVLWMKACGPLRSDQYVCHHCDNRACVNLEHLFVGSHKDNMADAARKKRLSNRRNRHTLKPSHIPQIRGMLAQRISQRIIADRFGVGQSCISDIKMGITWNRVQLEALRS